MHIAILSRNPSLYSTQSLIIAGRQRGHTVRVLDHMHCDLVAEKGNMQVYYHNERIDGLSAIIPRIGTTATTYGSAVVRHFMAMGVFSTLDPDALLRARDKLTSLQLMAANDIGVPRTVISNNPYVLPEAIDLVGSMPIIIKLVKGTHGLGVILSENKKNAEAVVESFYKLKERVLLQSFVKEANGADVRVFIVDGEIVGVMQRQAAAGEFRSNLHRGGSSFVVKLTDEEAIVAKKAAKLMGLAVCGVDMLRSNSGPMILEVNASPGLEGIETTTKVDIAGKIISFVERNAGATWRRN